MQQRESERTEIPSLKIAYNNVFGYYIEVRNTHKDKVPADWIRKQTLVNAERYITQELKEYEERRTVPGKPSANCAVVTNAGTLLPTNTLTMLMPVKVLSLLINSLLTSYL